VYVSNTQVLDTYTCIHTHVYIQWRLQLFEYTHTHVYIQCMYSPFRGRRDSKWWSECKSKSSSESWYYCSRSLFTWKFEKSHKTVVSWFWWGFRFAFRSPFRVSSSTERAVYNTYVLYTYEQLKTSMYVYMCMYTCVCIQYLCIRYIHMYTYTYIQSRHQLFEYTHTHTHTVMSHIRISHITNTKESHIRTLIRVHVSVCVYACMYVYIRKSDGTHTNTSTSQIRKSQEWVTSQIKQSWIYTHTYVCIFVCDIIYSNTHIHTCIHTNTAESGHPYTRVMWHIRKCNTLQHTATHRNILQHPATHRNFIASHNTKYDSLRPPIHTSYVTYTRVHSTRTTMQHTPTHCNTLQHAAKNCDALQHTATHCNTLQHNATHCNTLQHTSIS